MTEMFEYDLDFTLDEIRPTFPFDESCQGTVPQSIVAFLESTDYDSAIRLAISLGGDSDTIACITGGIIEQGTHTELIQKNGMYKRLVEMQTIE